MGGYESWGGTKILSDPAEGRIAKKCQGMMRMGGECCRAKRGWLGKGAARSVAAVAELKTPKNGVALDFKGQNDSKSH